MGDPFRAKLDQFRGAGRYPLKRVLPFYIAMSILGAVIVWSMREQWILTTTLPLYEAAQLTGVGNNGKGGPIVWVRTSNGRLIMLPANGSVLDCGIGAQVRLERRGGALRLARPACPR